MPTDVPVPGLERPGGAPVGIVSHVPPVGEDVAELLQDEGDDQDDKDHHDGDAADDEPQRVLAALALL